MRWAWLVVVATGCAADVPATPPRGLALLADNRLEVMPGPEATVMIERACVRLDDSFGGRYGGLPLTIRQYGGEGQEFNFSAADTRFTVASSCGDRRPSADAASTSSSTMARRSSSDS